jgi:fructokinase
LAQLEARKALGANAFERLAALTNEELQEIARVSGIAASMACEKTGAEPPTDSELAFLLSAIA